MKTKMYGVIATYTEKALNDTRKHYPNTQKEILMECDGSALYSLEQSIAYAEMLQSREWCESARVVEIKELNND